MDKQFDIIIIGGGPAGLSAAIYSARARFRTLVLEKGDIGGQISITSEVVNYPGIVKISGRELTNSMKEQAVVFGAEFLPQEVIEVDLTKDIKEITTKDSVFTAAGIILATGSSPRTLGFPGEEEFKGRGIAYCATCDGEFFTGKTVYVVGAGFAAAEEAVFLTRYAKKVIIIAREPEFTCAKGVAQKALENDKIEVKFNSQVLEAGGDNKLTFVKFINNETKEKWEHRIETDGDFGIFIFVGYAPATSVFKDQVTLNNQGYILTNEDLKTNLNGVYAAGDICVKKLRQVVTAVSDGAVAATNLEKYVEELYQDLGVKRKDVSLKPRPEEIKSDIENNHSAEFIDESIKNQLKPILDKLNRNINLVVAAKADDEFTNEMISFVKDFCALSNYITYEVTKEADIRGTSISYFPSIVFYDSDNKYTGIQFHGIPGGHEFNSFVIAIYNTAGSGQRLEDNIMKRIRAINKKVNLKIVISLSCTLCPDVVMAAQKIAMENPLVEAEMFDISHYKGLKEEFQIMSVPCIIMNDNEVGFGKKSIEELLNMIDNR